MTDPKKPLDTPPDEPAENDLTMDLTSEEFGDLDNLQILAEEMENYEPPQGEGTEDSKAARAEAEAELARLREQVEQLTKLDAEHQDKHRRLMADFSNHRNRVARETQLAVTLAERKLLLEMLPVLDSFERCVSAKYNSVEDFHAGALLIQRQLQEALRKAGVEPLEVHVGDPFDAQHAEALTTTTQKALPDGCVAAIYERGYRLRDQLLRPARVIVNNNPEPTGTEDPS
jgi:molecular chaperone GrpE